MRDVVGVGVCVFVCLRLSLGMGWVGGNIRMSSKHGIFGVGSVVGVIVCGSCVCFLLCGCRGALFVA